MPDHHPPAPRSDRPPETGAPSRRKTVPALSYELYPPRSAASTESLLQTIEALAPTVPDYVSVTAAVDPQRRVQSMALLSHLIFETPLRPLAHVLCTGVTEMQLRELIHELLDLGVRGILALRGDRDPAVEPGPEELPFARHLVDLIRSVERGRAAQLCAGNVSIGVAAYPIKHPESTSVHQDLEVLLAKQRAGADFAITQLYPEADDYAAFVSRARRAGVELPIIPGIMPVTSLRRYLRICDLAGLEPDPLLAHELETADSDAERHRIGVRSAVHSARAALDSGAPGLHLYTFNQHEAALDVLEQLDLPRPTPSAGLAGLIPASQPADGRPIRTYKETAVTISNDAQPAAFPTATILGYPRIGPNRELKRALESHWAGRSDLEQLESSAAELRASTAERLEGLGLEQASAVPGSYALYDHVLDTLIAVGAVPTRFGDLRTETGTVDRSGEFVLARGDDARQPLEMTKWFDTNYHYLVPEIGAQTQFAAAPGRLLEQLAEASEQGRSLRPVLVGPVTFLALAKDDGTAAEPIEPLDRLEELLPIYGEILAALEDAGAEWVQIDEPALVADHSRLSQQDLRAAIERAAGYLGGLDERPQLLLTSPYGDAGELLGALTGSGAEAVHVDLVRGGLTDDQLGLFTSADAPVLVAGVVNGRNVWRTDLSAALERLEGFRDAGARVSVATSNSLIHVPHTLEAEPELDPEIRSWLAFADEKVREVAVLARGLAEGRGAVAAELQEADEARRTRATAPGVRIDEVRGRTASLTEADSQRGTAEQRRAAQAGRSFGSGRLPVLPTTTIGSFPQTGEVRRARADHRAGRIDDAAYDGFLREEISRVIALQDELGLDVLVHGEPERNDMVQYFAEHFDGFATTANGWVQSYGSRATRPSILWGDVSREGEGLRGEAFTVPWITWAQQQTDKPVKGMLTGPVTILAWSFVRDDQPLAETADQVALALRDEIADLEDAGIGIIQVDEPALRELLPLRRADRSAYLDWSVESFRRATSSVDDATQIHTHLCYSEFGEVIAGVDALNADVTSIEAARSRMEVLADVRAVGFERGLGPGVWDIHSPRVPSTDEIESLLIQALEHVSSELLWVNPDCGLKTRGYDETRTSLEHLVEATARVRESLAASQAASVETAEASAV
ncbi:5-methyltetrahydropteroyltriglutamate--homocysteine S-methyltransferase [Kocuria palustris]|uniref:5-methyltetrahydropteroyltriglutamate-- homocysteine S-methyltransferase n=1 Tax=Kocuria palustris TaxID=71999 RepID=UPI0009E8224F|nr:5-methyltetrahydropteroyltriglutamate--homocysteine S-methyltransferase [Kocuria palustris]